MLYRMTYTFPSSSHSFSLKVFTIGYKVTSHGNYTAMAVLGVER
jgi:hypothetical protein